MIQTFIAAMMALIGPLTGKVISALGIGYLSYSALNALAESLKSSMLSSYSSIDADLLNMLDLLGVGTALNILIAAVITKASLSAIKKIGVLPS